MGVQESIIQIKGRVGNLSFYKTKDGYAVRKASGMNGERLKKDERFVRVRENMTEFGQASKATQTFRAAFKQDVKAVGDGRLSRRLSSLFHKLLRQDTANIRGARKVLPATLGALEGFEFNSAMSLTQSLNVPFTPVVTRSSGNLSVDIPAFSPTKLLTAPEGATHIVLMSTAAEVDFETQKYVSVTTQSAPIGVGEVMADALTLQHSIPVTTKPLILTFGFNFVQILGGLVYALKSGLHSVIQVVKVDTGIAV